MSPLYFFFIMQIDLFPITIHHLKLPDYAHQDIKEKYLPQILEGYDKNLYDASDLDWHTKNVHTSFNNDNQIIKEVPQIYTELFDSIMPCKWEGKFTIWHNVYKKQEYQEVHHHIPSDYSAIHFLSFDKDEHNPPVFFDPARLTKERLTHLNLTPFNSTHIDVDEGSVLIFPSYLEHLVPASKKEYNKHRVTVSLNLKFTYLECQDDI